MQEMQNAGVAGKWIVGLCAALALAVFAPAAASAQSGEQIFATRCAACHQADATGIPNMFPPLAGSELVNGDPGRVIKIILHGLEGDVEVKGETYNGVMPPWGAAMNDAEIAAVVTYLRSHFGNKSAAVTAPQVARIRAATKSRTKPWTIKELAISAAPVK